MISKAFLTEHYRCGAEHFRRSSKEHVEVSRHTFGSGSLMRNTDSITICLSTGAPGDVAPEAGCYPSGSVSFIRYVCRVFVEQGALVVEAGYMV